MITRTICITLLASAMLLISCQETPITREQVLTTMDSLEQKMDWLDYRIAQETWNLYTTGTADSLDYFRGLYNYLISNKETARILKQGKKLLTDEVDIRRLKLILTSFASGQVETNALIGSLRDNLTQIDNSFRAELDGKQYQQNELYTLYRTSESRSRREKAYRAYCQAGEKLSQGVTRLFRLRNQEARKLGYTNYLSLIFNNREIDTRQYLKLLQQLDSLSLQPYRDIIQDIQSRLNLTHVEIWDLAYAYNSINSKVDIYFPADSQLAYIKNSLKPLGFNLDKMPIYFDLAPRLQKSQLAYAFPIKIPYDIRVLANITDGAYSNRVLFHEIGHAIHFASIAQDRPLFTNAVDAAWSEGMAQIFAAFCDEELWLKKYAHLPPSLIESVKQARHDLDIIYLRTTLTRLMFEYEMYNNPNRDANKLYWDLFERYMMLPRHDDLYPWAGIIQYTTHPVYLQNYLYADIIAAQTLAKLREMYGDIIDNPSVGAFLVQNYFRFGARYDWRDLLERGTGERLNPEYLINRLNFRVQK